MKEHLWLNYPAAYNITKALFTLTKPTKTIDWSIDGPICSLGGPSFVVPFKAGSSLPIIFRAKYKSLLRLAKLSLGLINDSYPVAPGLDIPRDYEYAVVHWRRGDQEIRCSIGEDTSVNCNSAEELIMKVQQILRDGKYEHKINYNDPSLTFHRESQPKKIDPKNPPKVVYISTNEGNETILGLFEKAGFKTFKDLISSKGLPSTLSSLDKFVVELQMMIDADYYLAWGVSSIHDFVRAAFPRNVELEHRVHPERYLEPPSNIPTSISSCPGNITNLLKFYTQDPSIGFEMLPHEVKAMRNKVDSIYGPKKKYSANSAVVQF